VRGVAADEGTGTSVRIVGITESRPLGAGSYLALPDAPTAAVLVLSGSSGRLDVGRARLLAEHGAVALAWRWFGGPGQPSDISEVPLESFSPAVDLLQSLHPRVAVLGLSKGAEAALLLAVRDPRIQLVAALSPTAVVWAGLSTERPCRSSFTSRGVALPFIPYDDSWHQPSGVPAFRGLYEQSLETYADRVSAATIPVEQIAGDVVVTAGADDLVWPSELFARQIADRRRQGGHSTTVLVQPKAGHRLLLPRETPAAIDDSIARGGTAAADRELGASLWRELGRRLDLSP
jgi:uncharacterized protein